MIKFVFLIYILFFISVILLTINSQVYCDDMLFYLKAYSYIQNNEFVKEKFNN